MENQYKIQYSFTSHEWFTASSTFSSKEDAFEQMHKWAYALDMVEFRVVEISTTVVDED